MRYTRHQRAVEIDPEGQHPTERTREKPSPAWVEDRLMEAIDVFLRLPSGKAPPNRSMWPPYVCENDDEIQPRSIRPSPTDIDDAERVLLTWHQHVTQRQWWILTRGARNRLWHGRISATRLARETRCTRYTVYREWHTGLEAIAAAHGWRGRSMVPLVSSITRPRGRPKKCGG